MLAGRTEQAKNWVGEIAIRLDYCFKGKSKFPVGTDSFEDLVELEVNRDTPGLAEKLMLTSWSLATVAAWCAILELDEHYKILADGSLEAYKEVCAQLWHPTVGWPKEWYFGGALRGGETEAPYALLPTVQEMQLRMAEFSELPNYDWIGSSPSIAANFIPIDFIACRHFRMPVPAAAWYKFIGSKQGEDK